MTESTIAKSDTFKRMEAYRLSLGRFFDKLAKVEALLFTQLLVVAGVPMQTARAICALLQNRFDSFVYEEVVPAIRTDTRSDAIEVIAAGASIGAFNAVASLCRHPDVFRTAIGLSGTYDLERLFGFGADGNFYFSSPLLFLPALGEGAQLSQLRRCFVLLAFGQGRWEDPGESWRMAGVLGAKGVSNRVDPWGHEWDHDWPTWRRMLPLYLDAFAT